MALPCAVSGLYATASMRGGGRENGRSTSVGGRTIRQGNRTLIVINVPRVCVGRFINEKTLNMIIENMLENLILGHIAKELKDEIQIGRQVNLAKTIMQALRIHDVVGRSEQLQPEQECYKSGEPCKYGCSGLCKESC